MDPVTKSCPTCGKNFTVTNPRSRQEFCTKECRPPRKTYIEPRSCEICGKQFVPAYSCQKYCSKECKWKGYTLSKTVKVDEKTCIHCGKQFTPPSNKLHKKYCSQACYFASKDKTVTLTCEFCGKSFTKPYRHRNSKTCSRECFSGLMSKIVDTSEVKKCEACGEPFSVQKGSLEKTKYCSYDCFLTTRKTRQPPVTLTCEECGCEFTVPLGREQGRRFCTKSCALSGENNPRFGKPGTMTGRVPWSKGLTKETDERVRLLSEKNSVIMAEKLIRGEWKHNTGFKGEHYTGLKNGPVEVYLRSSYESTYARILDSDENVASWTHEPFRIPYFFDGSVHNYVPDFLVTFLDGSKKLVEVKPAVLTETPVNAAKSSAARVWCETNDVEFTIVSEDLLAGETQ